ncbi:YkgJ family cysteine cluster protein [Halomonas sp. ML-15]|uniref:YkgJ family cysteine cluster protein n=1 Tax=Halomonas sp. ML-15 TaxID=2773305 RepID=UPI00398F8E09
MVGFMHHKVKEFPCTQCGLCCQNVSLASETRPLDRGDGTCKHYNDASKICTIYADRPDICRVDRQYDLHYSNEFSWDEFIDLNLKACDILLEASEDTTSH